MKTQLHNTLASRLVIPYIIPEAQFQSPQSIPEKTQYTYTKPTEHISPLSFNTTQQLLHSPHQVTCLDLNGRTWTDASAAAAVEAWPNVERDLAERGAVRRRVFGWKNQVCKTRIVRIQVCCGLSEFSDFNVFNGLYP